MGAFPLVGMDRNAWSKDFETDLIALSPREKHDSFSEWVTEKFIPAFHNRIGEKFKVSKGISRLTRADQFKRPIEEGGGLYNYEETLLHKICRIATTVIASILPLCSIIILYVVENNAVRLGVIVLLTALFSLALALMTNSRTIEIFAATSA
jgi:hypothetical protein